MITTEYEEMLKGCIYKTPLAFLSIQMTPEVITFVKEILPFSTGFEIECDQAATFKIADFKNIPNIMDVNCSSWEQRFRIPNGVKGVLTLYCISEQLKLNCLLNPGSGIHYHVDMTDCVWDCDGPKGVKDILIDEGTWILEELDSWGYKGSYNRRDVTFGGPSWLRFSREHRTAEFRLGEMTFDYPLLIKRIAHCNSIIRRLKLKLVGEAAENAVKTIGPTDEFESKQYFDHFKNYNGVGFIQQKIADIKAAQTELHKQLANRGKTVNPVIDRNAIIKSRIIKKDG